MNLIDYREKHGPESWVQLAAKAGTSHAYVVQLAHGHRRPSVEMMHKLIVASAGELTDRGLRPDFFQRRGGEAA